MGTVTETLTWSTGGPYPQDYRPRTAGRFGCDPCRTCGKSPAAGARVWMNCYGDLYCDACAHGQAAAYDARGGHAADLEHYYRDNPASQCHACGRWGRDVMFIGETCAMCESCRVAEMFGD